MFVQPQVSDALLDLAAALSSSLQGRDEARAVAMETASRVIGLAQAEGHGALLLLAQPFAAQLQEPQVGEHTCVCVCV